MLYFLYLLFRNVKSYLQLLYSIMAAYLALLYNFIQSMYVAAGFDQCRSRADPSPWRIPISGGNYAIHIRHEPRKKITGLCKDGHLRPVWRLWQISGIYDLQLFQCFFHTYYKMEPSLLRSDVLL